MQRILRSYRRVAQENHFCDCCCRDIWPGEEYEASVEIWKRGDGKRFLVVWKKHVNPMCDPPEEPIYDEEGVEEEDDFAFDLPMAA